MVYFDFDSSRLSENARMVMRSNAEKLKKNTNRLVMVEGHCDQRGTIEYNLALAQKRAQQTREYYISLGVPAGVMGTISYGKEKPECTEENEDCWARNRRAVTKIKAD